MKLSICIPTYNRANNLVNCLESIALNKMDAGLDFEVCVSDNCSIDDTENVVINAQKKINIKYRRNKENLGRVRNYLNVVEMAEGDFVWMIGDDELLLPNTIGDVIRLIDEHKAVDFFYINSYHLDTEYVDSFPQPFDTVNLPKKMEPFSNYTKSGELPFLKLVSPEVSFDFLGGMFLAIFKRTMWLNHVDTLDKQAIVDTRIFSHFDNTFPHLKIFINAFSKSNAYFCAKPLSVCLTGAREWAPMYPLVRSVRLIEALDEYKKNGLPLSAYLKCKNYALNYFIPDLILMVLHRKNSGLEFIHLWKHIIRNFFYPNFYLSFFYYFGRKFKQIMS